MVKTRQKNYKNRKPENVAVTICCDADPLALQPLVSAGCSYPEDEPQSDNKLTMETENGCSSDQEETTNPMALLSCSLEVQEEKAKMFDFEDIDNIIQNSCPEAVNSHLKSHNSEAHLSSCGIVFTTVFQNPNENKTFNGNFIRNKIAYNKPISLQSVTKPNLDSSSWFNHWKLVSGGKYNTYVSGHINDPRVPENGVWKCEVCLYETKKKGNFFRHMRSHTGEKRYACELCSYKSTRKDHLEDHVQRHTTNTPLSCDQCSYQTIRKNVLLRHKRIHTGEKPYPCDFCPFRAMNRRSLYAHRRTHTGEEPYTCPVCAYKTDWKHQLTEHMRYHNEGSLYTCNECDYKTGHKIDMRRHILKHSGEKPLACDYCEYRTGDKRCLTKHVMLHTGEKPYACELCPYRAKQRILVRRHTLRCHKDEISDSGEEYNA